MFGWLKTHLDRLPAPELDWIQVEVTTCCNSSCIYCPQHAMETRLPKRHMAFNLFLKLSPFIKFTKMIYLQGWGEPLLHPDLFKMIRICKAHRKCVGFTTNGMGLNEKTIHGIIDSKLDILGVSLAGVTAASHNRFRCGNDFDVVMKNLRLLNQIKKERNSPFPALHLAFLMLRSNFHEIKEIVPLAKELGVKQIVASTLSLILNRSLSTETIFNDMDDTDIYCETLENIKKSAVADNIIFVYSRPVLDETATHCSENVCHACIVTVDGDVTPCVFMNPVLCGDPCKGDNRTVHYWFKNRALPLKGVSFGNIQNENLSRIWHKKAYAEFRACFDPDQAVVTPQISPELPDSCRYCYKRLTGYR